jgi:hypothetical protein
MLCYVSDDVAPSPDSYGFEVYNADTKVALRGDKPIVTQRLIGTYTRTVPDSEVVSVPHSLGYVPFMLFGYNNITLIYPSDGKLYGAYLAVKMASDTISSRVIYGGPPAPQSFAIGRPQMYLLTNGD